MKMPSIPGWVWLALIFGVIPLLCCCCCLYLCCCRKKGAETRAADPYPGQVAPLKLNQIKENRRETEVAPQEEVASAIS